MSVERPVPWEEVDRQLRRIARRRGELDAEELPWLLAAERADVHRELGYATVLEYLERVLGYTPRVARDRLRMAHALERLPVMTAALREGRLPVSAVRELVRVAVAGTEDAWIAAATGRTVREIEDLVAGRKPGARPEDPADHELALRVLRLEISPATFALFRQAQQVLELELGARLSDDELVAALARSALADPNDLGAPSRPAHQIATTVCEQCERGWQDGAGARIAVGPAAVAQAQCDADDLGSLDADAPARSSSTIPLAIRRLIWRRFAGRCAVPGCRSARHLEIHHLVPRADGGGHDPENLCLLCSAHHHRHHDGRLVIRGRSPDRLEFLHADGKRYGAPAEVDGHTEPEDCADTGCGGAPGGADGSLRRAAAMPSAPSTIIADAEAVLRSSGWDRRTSRTAVDRAVTHVGQDGPLEVLVRAAFGEAAVIARMIQPRPPAMSPSAEARG